MFLWIRNVWDIQSIAFKVKIIESTRFLGLALMIKYIQDNGCDELTLGY